MFKRAFYSTMALLLATPALAFPATYTPDPSHTYAYFEVGHLGYSIQRGRFDKLGGKIRLDGASQQGVIDIMIDAEDVINMSSFAAAQAIVAKYIPPQA